MMKIRLERSGKFLMVLFSHADLAKKDLEGGAFRRRYGSSPGMTFTFEKRSNVYFLYVSFDRYKDAEVLDRIRGGRPVAELQVLSRLAHLPCAKIYVTEVPLPGGRNVDLIDTVRFELRKISDGVWESRGTESEVEGLRRQMTLKSVKEGLPGFYLVCGTDRIFAIQPRSETIFAHRVKEIKIPETEEDPPSAPELDPGGRGKAPAERVPGTAERSGDLQREEEPSPRVNTTVVSEDRDPSEIADCNGCGELCRERELTEVKPGVYVCQSCGDDGDTLVRLGLTPDEIESFWRLTKCDFKKPAAADINKAIHLLLWRCRDAEIHKDKPEGKGGFYRLDDWIAKANDDMIRELGLWCADIQELNIGTRDS